MQGMWADLRGTADVTSRLRVLTSIEANRRCKVGLIASVDELLPPSFVSKSEDAKYTGHPQREESANRCTALHDPCAEVAHRSDFSSRPFEMGSVDSVEYEHGHFRTRPMVLRQNF